MTGTSRFFLSLPVFLAVLGCSNSNTPSGVHGKVTYKGEPVPAGTVTFHRTGKDQIGSYPFSLNSDGSYEGTTMPAEEMVVTIDTESVNPNKPKPVYSGEQMGNAEYAKKMRERTPDAAKSSEAGKYVAIPPKYADKEKSPLKVTLTKGKQKHNFELQD